MYVVVSIFSIHGNLFNPHFCKRGNAYRLAYRRILQPYPFYNIFFAGNQSINNNRRLSKYKIRPQNKDVNIIDWLIEFWLDLQRAATENVLKQSGKDSGLHPLYQMARHTSNRSLTLVIAGFSNYNPTSDTYWTRKATRMCDTPYVVTSDKEVNPTKGDFCMYYFKM